MKFFVNYNIQSNEMMQICTLFIYGQKLISKTNKANFLTPYMFLQNLHIVLKRHKTFPNLVVVQVYIQKRAIKINLSSNLFNVGAIQYK
jgi:hypothetical protein